MRFVVCCTVFYHIQKKLSLAKGPSRFGQSKSKKVIKKKTIEE